MKTFKLILFLMMTSLFSCDNVDIIDLLSISVETDISPIFINDTVTFKSTINPNSAINNLTYNWHFPGGTPEKSEDKYPHVTYNYPGTFDVKLIVSDNSIKDSIIINDYIKVNGLFCGKKEGLNIVHDTFPLKDDYFDSFDINNDGILDIEIIHYSFCCRNRADKIFIKPLNGTKLSTTIDSITIYKHSLGEIISPKLTWTKTQSGICLSGLWRFYEGNGIMQDYTCGLFNVTNKEGYICFNINDHKYGWIKLTAYSSYWGSYIALWEYAYTDID